MTALAEFREFSTKSLKLDTLVKLRWLAVGGQIATVLVTAFGLRFAVPVGWCLLPIVVSIGLNLFLRRKFAATYRLDSPAATVLLAYDVLQLGTLLFLTGGLENPFSYLLLAPVMVSSASLPPQSTAALGALVATVATVLGMVHWPLPWGSTAAPVLPELYVVAIWFSIVATLVFSALYAFRVAHEARQLAEALAAAELVLQREQHLTALDGLAAAAAHELGTPLGTIAVVTKELERELPAGSPIADDIGLLRSQSERCREILRKLTTLGTDIDKYFVRMPLASMLQEVTEPYREFGVKLTVRKLGRGAEPVAARNPAILYGLGNIIENAVDFAKSEVEIAADWDSREVTLTISDDGPGFSPEIIDRLGEPYVTTRERLEAREGDDVGGGLGLGYFIAKTLLKRSGAKVLCSNRRFPETGARIRITWPRALIEAPVDPITGETA
ncbi:ActS/PrrB/RegB family redox-sensitive histidine kinase [Methyloraptor flagellatus]|uniref:histidine kinase n=1 Tax=Methyloraptor flagellatus TaxID=3162530 RepID=A0AAU7X7J6_9HYPH